MNEPYVQSLRDAIKKMHGCTGRYSQTVMVKEESRGVVKWEGAVEVFDLAGHATGRHCYAWGFKDAEGRRQFVAILNPPVKSAAEAVREYLAREGAKKAAV